MTLVSVIIPVYKIKPFEKEIKSFTQCIKVLINHPISIVCPDSMDTSFYEEIATNCGKKISIQKFNDLYFKDIQGYNNLLLSIEFYKRFESYKYVLLYQLDAWVFRDELDYWCGLGYDYIGAPWIGLNLFSWFQTGLYPKKLFLIHKFLVKGKIMCKVGNGGFSLRNVKGFLFNIQLFKKTSSAWMANEDSFYSHYVKTFNPFFRIAPVKLAVKFSFDTFPQKAFELNNRKLPFGCHAWDKNEPPYPDNYTFWEKVIQR